MKKRKLIYLLSGLCPLVIIALTWFFNHFFPFGTQSFLAIDFNQQFIDLYLFMRNSLLSGDFNSLFYSFTKSLGGNMVGAWAYYLLSPFNLFYLIIPLKYVSYAIFLSVWLRYAAFGLSMAYYFIKRHQGANYPLRTVIFAVAYALNGFAVSYQMVPIFMDALWLLPLVLVALEKFLDGHEGHSYVLLLALTMFIQYYMGYMICLFIFIYTFYYLFIHYGHLKKSTFVKVALSKVIHLGVLSLIGIGLTAFILLPNIHNLLASKGALNSSMTFDWEFQINPLDILAKLMIGSFDNNGWSAGPNLPNIYMGSIGLIGLVLYYLSDKIKKRNKVASSIILLVFFFSISHEWTSKIWHMGQNPAGFFYRFSWIIVFFILTLAYQGLKESALKSWKVLLLLALTFFVQALILPKDYTFLTAEQRQASALIFGLMVLILYFIKKGSWQWGMILMLTFFELGINAYISQGAINHNNAYKFENALHVIDQAVDQIRPDQSDFYRISKTFYRSKNDPMTFNYPGMTTFSSSLESSTRDLFENLGNSAIDASIYYYGTPLTDALLGVKYYIANEPYVTDQQEEMDRTYIFPTDVSRKDITVTENKINQTSRFSIYQLPQTLPIAYAINQAASDLKLLPNQPITNQNAIAKALTDQTQDIFEEVDPAQSSTNLIHGATESGQQIYSRKEATANASYTLTFTPDTDDPYFVNIPKSVSTYQDEVTILVNGEKLDYRSKFGSDQVFNIANRQKGQRLELTLEIKADRQFNLTQLKIVRFDQQVFNQVVSKLQKEGMVVDNWGSNFVNGSLNVNASSWVMTSIPYDTGWQVFVDGHEVDTYPIWDALLGFQVEAGDHQLALVFKPKGLVLGSILSLLALISFVGLYIFDRVKPSKAEDTWYDVGKS